VYDFASAGLRAKKAGFDGIQLHCAHGYLIHQFLNPSINVRKDIYGFNCEMNIRFLKEIVEKIRESCGYDFPITLKISGGGDNKKADDPKRFIQLINKLDKLPIDAIEISYGTMENALNIFRGASIPLNTILKHNFKYKTESKIKKSLWKLLIAPILSRKLISFTQNYNLKYAKLVKCETPIICVGGFRSWKSIKSVLEEGMVDYVSMCRPFLCEPDLMHKLNINNNWESLCKNCNICAIMCDSTEKTRCYVVKSGVS